MWAAVGALAAVVVALVAIIVNREAISEFFGEKEEYPRSRGWR